MMTMSKPLSAGQAQRYHHEQLRDVGENYYSEGQEILGEWHGRLVEEKNEREGVVVTLLAYSLEWLACWIFSFGSRAEVLAPETLKELVATEARQVATKYTTSRKAAVRSLPIENLVVS